MVGTVDIMRPRKPKWPAHSSKSQKHIILRKRQDQHASGHNATKTHRAMLFCVNRHRLVLVVVVFTLSR